MKGEKNTHNYCSFQCLRSVVIHISSLLLYPSLQSMVYDELIKSPRDNVRKSIFQILQRLVTRQHRQLELKKRFSNMLGIQEI